MENIEDKAKLLAAYRILNKQLAESNTQLKRGLATSELRINEINCLVLQTRKENQFLRSATRKLKEQLQMITRVMRTVENYAETITSRINHQDQEQEGYEQLRQPVAPAVYERKRAAQLDFVDDAVIQEEEPEGHENDASNPHDRSSNPVTRSGYYDDVAVHEDEDTIHEAVEEGEKPDEQDEEDEEDEDEEEEEEDEDGDDEDSEPNVTIELPAAYAHLAAQSPLVLRLKRKSRRGSFNESFETIDRDRVFKLSRHSQSQRESNAGLSPNHSNNNNDAESDLDTPRTALSQKRNDSDMDIDESIIEAVRNISVFQNESILSFESTKSKGSASLTQSPCEDTSSNSPSSQISNVKETIRKYALPLVKQLQTTTTVGNISVIDTTVFNPEDVRANATCSTPVTKGVEMGGEAKDIRKRFEIKTKSETDLLKNSLANAPMQPVVVLQPLTEYNLKQHELSGRRERRNISRSRAITKYYYKENDSENDASSDTRRQGVVCKLEQASSTENLSVQSYESGRPRRKAAPVDMRERSLNSKLRRQ
ncbi:hypothetical protein AND_003974 [Anopheles darlingi]|uniref:Shugoshin C-terminal domain-containing protein n=1 Tax=Anopheles darlingi TaxID=43151 RepID=W5JIS6_ANODA|nr:hypothetical protein AND_003974 [Anopheles darlingi]